MVQTEATEKTGGKITQEQFDAAWRLVQVDKDNPGSHPYSAEQIAAAQDILRRGSEQGLSLSLHSVR